MTIAYKGILVTGKCHTFKFNNVHVIIITQKINNMAKQKLSRRAAAAKKKRDLQAANTRRREKMRAENQRKRRKAKKKGKNIKGKDYDHTKKKFVSGKANRGGHGRGTKKKK